MSAPPTLYRRVEALRQRVAALVATARADDADPDDPFRGLYVADHHVDRILARPPLDAAAPPPAPDIGAPIPGQPGPEGEPLDLLAQRAGLSPVDVEVLVAALAPDLDPGFEKLYVYLNDDITRRRAGAGLALRLAGGRPWEATSRARLLPGAPLVDLGLVEVGDPERPFLTRSLRVPDHVVQHLLGQPTAPADVAAMTVTAAQWPDPALVDRLARAFVGGRGFLHLHDPGDAGGLDLATSVVARAGMDAFGLDLARSPVEGVDPAAIVREVVLRGAGLVVASAERAQPDLLRDLVEQTPALVMVSRESWDPHSTARTPVAHLVTPVQAAARRELWRIALHRASGHTGLDPAALDPLRLAPGAIGRAAGAAAQTADMDDNPLSLAHLQDAARQQASSRLERLARRIRPGVTWDDLVVDDATRADLELLVARARHREQVLDDWGLRRRSGHAEGTAALFAGDSGTGKTLAAEVIAAELGLELYVIDLSTVVDKYIGETEKNLERVFSEAEGVNGVLFFDEADALFGKRSEVADARDRYANTEVAYLLQRIETFDGIAIMATNLRANVDEAFLRRLAAVLEFPDPDEHQRLRLWTLHLRTVPDDGQVDLDFLSRSFTLSGGNIRNIAVAAAYMAAANGRLVGMTDLIQAVALEYRKLGRLRDESEFGPWVEVLAGRWNNGQSVEVL